MAYHPLRLDAALQMTAAFLGYVGFGGPRKSDPRRPLKAPPWSSPRSQPLHVFISYSHKRRAKAARLARQLSARGFTVWWDHDLIPTGRYHLDIDAKLDAAMAIVVIWSKESIGSDWVRSEAEHAYYQRKLINVHSPDIQRPARELPKPFCVRHSARVGDIEAIVAALEALNVQPSNLSRNRR